LKLFKQVYINDLCELFAHKNIDKHFKNLYILYVYLVKYFFLRVRYSFFPTYLENIYKLIALPCHSNQTPVLSSIVGCSSFALWHQTRRESRTHARESQLPAPTTQIGDHKVKEKNLFGLSTLVATATAAAATAAATAAAASAVIDVVAVVADSVMSVSV